MDLRTRTGRFVAGALAALTLSSTTLVSRPAEAWNPIGWVVHSSGSMLNRVVHGVLGSVVMAAGVVTFLGGIALIPVLGPLGILISVAGGGFLFLFGLSMLGGAVENQGTLWWWVHHIGGGSGSGGSNAARSGAPGNGSSAALGSPSGGLGQTR